MSDQDFKTSVKDAGLLLYSNAIVGALDFEAPSVIGFGNTISNISIGAYSYISDAGSIDTVSIGRYCSISGRVIIGGEIHPTDSLTSSPVAYGPGGHVRAVSPFGWYKQTRGGPKIEEMIKPTIIGHDVWIGSRATVLGGVTIGTGAIVGAGSVVTKDVSPYAIVASSPAREIRKRFNDSMIERLLKLKWWEYDLPDWLSAQPDLPIMPLDMAKLEHIEKSIEAGTAPKIVSLKHRLLSDGRGKWQLMKQTSATTPQSA